MTRTTRNNATLRRAQNDDTVRKAWRVAGDAWDAYDAVARVGAPGRRAAMQNAWDAYGTALARAMHIEALRKDLPGRVCTSAPSTRRPGARS